MRMKNLVLICVCCVLAAPAGWGQTANTQAKPGILGYLDPHTGAFRPVPTAPTEEPDFLAAATTVGGTVNVTLTITLKTAGLTNITCSESVSVQDNLTGGSLRLYTESDTVAATGTGTTRSCKLSIPYSWSLLTPTTDSMTTGYSVTGVAGTTGLPTRSSSLSSLDSRKVPANGTITALTAAVTL
jgi:hypothetical protein